MDAEAEKLGEASVQAFETEGLIGSATAAAVLAYLFHRIEGCLDGRPTLLLIVERAGSPWTTLRFVVNLAEDPRSNPDGDP